MFLQVAYVSRAVAKFDKARLDSLLRHSRRNNRKLDLTGLLLYEDGLFLQVLEGPPNALWELYEVIEADPSHTEVEKVAERPIRQREFGLWRMGFGILNSSDSDNGIDDRIRSILKASDAKSSLALDMLYRFREKEEQLSLQLP
ncbi:MAG: BLUF domain-containing protein [Pseudomonadota bacterium]